MLSHSDSLITLAPALAQVQAEIENIYKSNTATVEMRSGGRYAYKYADLTSVLDAIGPLMEKYGFSYSQHPGFRDDGQGPIVTVETLLLHSSGEWILSEAATPLENTTPQGTGGAITYLRRYALVSIIGLGQEDDDAQEASRPRSQPLTEEQRAKAATYRLDATAPTAREMRDLLNVAAEQGGVSREDILAFTDDPFLWLREHQYAYATLVAAARSARDAKPVTTADVGVRT